MATGEELLRQAGFGAPEEPAPAPAPAPTGELTGPDLLKAAGFPIDTAPEEHRLSPEEMRQDQLNQQILTDEDAKAYDNPEVFNQLRQAVTTPFTEQPEPDAPLREYVSILQRAGHNVNFALDEPYKSQIMSRAKVMALDFMQDQGLMDLQGEGIEDAKRSVINAFTVAGLVQDMPVAGDDAETLTKTVLSGLVKNRMDEILSQSRPDLAPEVREEVNRLTGLAAVINQAPQEITFQLYNRAMSLRLDEARSPVEEERSEDPKGATISNKLPIIRSALTSLEGSLIHPGQARSTQITDVQGAARAVLGPNWARLMTDGFRRGRTKYNLGKLGINIDGKDVVSAYSPDGANFVPSLVGDKFEKLIQAKINQVTPDQRKSIVQQLRANPETREVLDSAYQLGGSRLQTETIKSFIDDTVTSAAEVKAKMQLLGPEPRDETLTPEERRVAGTVTSVGLDIMTRLEELWERGRAGVRGVDEAIFGAKGLDAGPEVAMVLTGDPDLASTSKGLIDSLKLGFLIARDRKGITEQINAARTGLFGQRFSALEQSHPIFQNSTAEERRALMEFDNDVWKAYGERFADANRAQEKRTARMSKYIRAKQEGKKPEQSLLGHMEDAAASTINLFIQGMVGTGAAIADTPEDAVLMMLTAHPGVRAGQAARSVGVGILDAAAGQIINLSKGKIQLRAPTFSRWFQAQKRFANIQRLTKANPELAKKFDKIMKEHWQQAWEAGDMDSINEAWRSSTAAVRRAANEYELTGMVQREGRPLSRALADNWDEITAQTTEFGGIAQLIDEPGSILQRLDTMSAAFFGKEPKVRANTLLDSPEPGDMATKAINHMVNGTEDVEIFAKNVRDFETNTGKVPTLDEMQGMMPRELRNLVNLVDAAQKHPLATAGPGVTDRIRSFFTQRGGNPDLLPFLKQTVEDVTTMITERATVKTQLNMEWNLKRGRIRRILEQVREKADTDLEAQRLELETLVADADFTDIDLAPLHKRMEVLDSRVKRSNDLLNKLERHNSDQRYNLRELDVLDDLSDQDIENLFTEAPELFGGPPEDIIAYRTVKGTPKQIDRVNSRLANLEKRIEKSMQKVREAETATAKSAAGGRLIKQREQYDALRRQAVTLKEGRQVRVGVDRKKFFDRITHSGADDAERAVLSSLTDLRRTINARQQLGGGGNPFLAGGLPIHQATRQAAHFLRNASDKIMGVNARMELLIRAMNEATPEERALMNRMRITAGDPTAKLSAFKRMLQQPDVEKLLKKYPELRYWSEGLNKKVALLNQMNSNLSRSMGELYGWMEKSGLVEKPVVDFFRKKGYTPHIHGVNERLGLVTKESLKESLASLKPKTAFAREPLTEATGEALKFQRDLADWRLVIDEPEIRREFFFPNKERAMQFLRRRYGKDITPRFKSAGEGISTADIAATGDKIRLGKPLGREGIQVLETLWGKNAEAQAIGVNRAIRDVGGQMMLDALNVYGGLVMTEAQALKLAKRYGPRFTTLYRKMPDDPTIFGQMAGKHVHRSVLKTLNHRADTHEAVNAMLEGARKSLAEVGADVPLPVELAAKPMSALGRSVDAIRNVARDSFILRNFRSYIINPMFNVFLDLASGVGLYKPENFHHYLRAAKLRRAGRRGGMEALNDPIFREAMEVGMDVGFFEGNPAINPSRDMLRRMTGLNEVKKLELLQSQRNTLINKLDRFGTETPAAKQAFIKLVNDKMIVEARMADLQKGWMRKFGEAIGSFWIDRPLKDITGRKPIAGFHDAMRQTYNDFDAIHKIATYALHRERGFDVKQAANQVLKFAQNYSGVPRLIRPTGTKGLFLSLVTSFPYEATRLFANLWTHRPGNMMALMSLAPMLNLGGMIANGVSRDQFLAQAETRGMKTPLQSWMSWLDTIYLFGKGGHITSSVNINMVNPFQDLVGNEFGAVAQAYKNVLPEDFRNSFAGSLLGLPVKYLNNFVGNNPILDGAAFLVTGNDVRTGRKVFDSKMNYLDQTALALKGLAQYAIPPQFPFGRDFNDYVDSAEAPFNPRTRRPFNAQQRGTVISGVLGLRLKGKLATKVDRLFKPLLDPVAAALSPAVVDDFEGVVPVNFSEPENVIINEIRKAQYDPVLNATTDDFPIESVANEERKYLLKLLNETDNVERQERIRGRLNALIEETYNREMGPLKEIRLPTDRERFKLFQKIKNYTPEATLARMRVHQKVAALIGIDKTGLVDDSRFRSLMQSVKHTASGNYSLDGDPEIVQLAIDKLDSYLVENPDHNPRLKDYRKHLTYVLREADKRYRRETLKAERRRKREELIRRIQK